MKKVLIIAPYFTPRRRVGAQRPHKFAMYLSQFGWNPAVLCIETLGAKLTPKESIELENVKIYSLKPPFDRTTTSSKQKENPSAEKKKNSLSNWFDKIFPIDTWLPFFWNKRKEIEKIVEEFNPDIIWSTSDPWSGAIITGYVAKKKKVKWVADFRDPWTLCRVRFPKKGWFARIIEKKAESWIVKNADFMTFTAKNTEKLYISYYPELKGKTDTIYNSYNEGQNFEPDSKRKDKLQILFLGTFRWLSNAKLIIEILHLIKKQKLDLLDFIEINSYGSLPEDDLILAKKYGIESVFKVRDKVPNELVQKEISDSDLLLLSTHPDRKEIVPAKLLDYLPSSKPILSLVQNDEVKDILQKTGRGVQFKVNESEKAAAFLMDLIQAKREKSTPVYQLYRDEKEIIEFSAEATTKKLIQVLNEVNSHE